MRQSSKESSAVSEQSQPVLSSLRLTLRPGVPASTIKSEIPRLPLADASVRAATMMMSP